MDTSGLHLIISEYKVTYCDVVNILETLYIQRQVSPFSFYNALLDLFGTVLLLINAILWVGRLFYEPNYKYGNEEYIQ